jgi:hypothetical protein
MTKSHVLLHCPSARLSAVRTEAWELGKEGIQGDCVSSWPIPGGKRDF